jgi:hypothetical protein
MAVEPDVAKPAAASNSATPSPPAAQATHALVTATNVFRMALRLVVTIGCFFACVGSNYCELAIRVALGSKWASTSVPVVLSVYCAYVLAMAANGMCEV